MSYKQIKSFKLSKMGKTKGYCLKNVRLGFGIGAKYASAKDAMNADKKAKVFHAGIPTDKTIQVPVYIDTTSKYEHVIVWDKGTCYSDGTKCNINLMKVFGWSEYCDGVRVVEKIAEPKKKSVTEIAKEVIAGKWGNGLTRKNKLTKAGYNYNEVQKKVNELLK